MRGVVFAALAVGVASTCPEVPDVNVPVPVKLGITVNRSTATISECCAKCDEQKDTCDFWQWFDNEGKDVENCQLLTAYAGDGGANQSFWFGDFSSDGGATKAPSAAPSAAPSTAPSASPSAAPSEAIAPTAPTGSPTQSKTCTTINTCMDCNDCDVGELWGGRISTDELTSELLSSMTGVQTLDFHSSSLEALPENFLDAQANLDYLDLEDNVIKSLPQGIFDKCTKLRVLRLATNKLTELRADVFKMNTELKTLYLDHNNLATLPEGIFDTLQNLETVSLNVNKLTALPTGIFDGATSLQTVYLQDNMLTNFPKHAFANNLKLKQLVFRNQGGRMTVMSPGVLASLTAGVDIFAPPEVLCTEIGETYNEQTHSICIRHNKKSNLCIPGESWTTGLPCLTADPDSLFEYEGVQYGCPFPTYTGSVSPVTFDPYYNDAACALTTGMPTGAPTARPTPAPTASPVANTTAAPKKNAASTTSSLMAATIVLVVVIASC